MPLYEYKCQKCQTIKSEIRETEMRDADMGKCECGGELSRIMSTCNHKIHGYCYKNSIGGGDYNDFVPE